MGNLVLPDPRLTDDHYIDYDDTEFVQAGDIYFGIGYRFVHHHKRGGGLADEIKDHGVAIHVLVGGIEQQKERLRFDCLEMRPHYHYMDWSRGDKDWFHQVQWLDTVTAGDSVQWTLDKLRTRLVPMLVRARAVDEARGIDLAQVETGVKQVAAWTGILKERALSDWNGPISMVKALSQLYKHRESPGDTMPPIPDVD